MARFILDVANVPTSEECNEIISETITAIELGYPFGKVITMACIDETNNNQFHENPTDNQLSIEQIKNQGKTYSSEKTEIEKLLMKLSIFDNYWESMSSEIKQNINDDFKTNNLTK